jgi:hypothetical protein
MKDYAKAMEEAHKAPWVYLTNFLKSLSL